MATTPNGPRGLVQGRIIPRKGDHNPFGYGYVYAVAANGDTWILDRCGPPDISDVQWRVYVVRAGHDNDDWEETFTRRKDAIERITRRIQEAKG